MKEVDKLSHLQVYNYANIHRLNVIILLIVISLKMQSNNHSGSLLAQASSLFDQTPNS